MIRKKISLFLCLALVISLLGVPDAALAKKKKLKLNKKKVTLYVGKTVRLKVKGTKKKVKWKSSKKKVATVSKKGKVKARKKGTAKITAKVAGKKLVCKVKVKNKRKIPSTKKPSVTKRVVTKVPTSKPTTNPTKAPATSPAVNPAETSSASPSANPTKAPTASPATNPTKAPTASPATNPTKAPTTNPTKVPTASPTKAPTASPTTNPTKAPTASPIVSPTVSPVKTPAPTPATQPYALDMTKLNWKNTSAYASAWKGNTYSISQNMAGAKVSDYTQVRITLNLYDSSKNLIQGTEQGSASVKLSTKSSDWAGFVDMNGVASGVEIVLSLDSMTGGDLYLVVQNSKAAIAYIEVTSVILEKKAKANAAEACSYTPLAQLAAQYGFKMGTNISARTMQNAEQQKLVEHHFNSITMSNEMKAYSLLDENASKASADGMPVMKYDTADKLMDYAKSKGLSVRGHALVWDAGMNDWFFHVDYDVNKGYADSPTMKIRLKSYIEQVMTHFEEKYPGMIYCWDVVNEAVETGKVFESGDKRCVEDNIFSQRIGRDYVELSFQYARETADALKKKDSRTDIKLFYNDFNTFYSDKRDAIIELVKSINHYKSDGNGGYVKLCDGVGMQSYIGGYNGNQSQCLKTSDITSVKTAIEKYAALGIEVHVSELAVRNYDGSEAVIQKHAEFYEKLFNAYLTVNAEAKAAGKTGPITSISIWGLCDNPDLPPTDYSYKMNGTYCGLFTELYAVKPSFLAVYNLLNVKNS